MFLVVSVLSGFICYVFVWVFTAVAIVISTKVLFELFGECFLLSVLCLASFVMFLFGFSFVVAFN